MSTIPRPVVVDGKAYPSINSAAVENFIRPSTLSCALSRGRAEACGLSIRYAEEAGASTRAEPYAGISRPVRVDGVRYPSINAAAREVMCAPTALSRALKSGRKIYLGRSVSYDR